MDIPDNRPGQLQDLLILCAHAVAGVSSALQTTGSRTGAPPISGFPNGFAEPGSSSLPCHSPEPDIHGMSLLLKELAECERCLTLLAGLQKEECPGLTLLTAKTSTLICELRVQLNAAMERQLRSKKIVPFQLPPT